MKKNIGILGATGLVGSSVLSALQGKGYALLIGARNQYKLQCLEKMYRNKSTENEKTIFWFGIELVNGNDVEKKLMSFEYACNWNSLSGYVCALVAEWCLNDEISKGKAYNLDEIEGIQKFIESLPGEIKQNIVKL